MSLENTQPPGLLATIRSDRAVYHLHNRSTRVLMALHRIGHALVTQPPPSGFLARKARGLALRLVHYPYGLLCHSYGCFLPFEATLGQRVEFRHSLYGVFISQGAVIGDDVVIFHQVTIGSNYDTSGEPGSPVVGSRVILGAGAKIIGKVVIGDDVRIATNVSVARDVPPCSTVVPAAVRVIERVPVPSSTPSSGQGVTRAERDATSGSGERTGPEGGCTG